MTFHSGKSGCINSVSRFLNYWTSTTKITIKFLSCLSSFIQVQWHETFRILIFTIYMTFQVKFHLSKREFITLINTMIGVSHLKFPNVSCSVPILCLHFQYTDLTMKKYKASLPVKNQSLNMNNLNLKSIQNKILNLWNFR